MGRMGLEISRLRKEIGMTQKQLAKIVGVTEGFIIDVETGKKIPKSDLITKISKALRKEVDKLDLFETDAMLTPEPDKKVVKVIEKPVQAIWSDALAGVLANVPVYNYKMDQAITTKHMPIMSGKIEGFPKDKVFYLSIEDDDMAGFRISKGDMAFAFSTHELDKDAIFLIEFNDRRLIRQIKVLDSEKLLLVSNKGSIITSTVMKKDVKIIARLVRVEITL